MDPYDREASYYEISLTNRQVVTGFVILLACLFAAFLSGVWIGQGGTGSAAPGPQIAESTPPPAAPGSERLEQLTFFGEKERPASTVAPEPSTAAPSRPTAAEREAEKLRRTLEEEMAANRAAEAEPPAAPVAAATTPAPGTRVRREPALAPPAEPEPTRAPAPAAVTPAAPAATSAAMPATWIQVYSSNNGARAREITERLRRSGFEVRTLETEIGGSTAYRVRVGPYAARTEADRAAARLRREFRLDTWVTDQP